ncbi:UNVERIFIED_CONTAM: Peptide-N(4)-(N-acetyl-beta-glucosaminyl)asparagine amidase [Sesamum indicum]
MVARKFIVEHGGSAFDLEYDTDDGFEVLQYQLFSLTSIPPDQQKILGGDENRMLLDDSDLNLISEKLRVVLIDEDEKAKEMETTTADLMTSDEELARILQILDFTDHVWTECFSPYLGRFRFLAVRDVISNSRFQIGSIDLYAKTDALNTILFPVVLCSRKQFIPYGVHFHEVEDAGGFSLTTNSFRNLFVADSDIDVHLILTAIACLYSLPVQGKSRKI